MEDGRTRAALSGSVRVFVVVVEARQSGELSFAYHAFVCSGVGTSAHVAVFVQLRKVAEFFVAITTDIFGIAVGLAVVFLECPSMKEPSFAPFRLTGIRINAGVLEHVRFEVSFLGETSVARCANKRCEFLMCQFVTFEVVA